MGFVDLWCRALCSQPLIFDAEGPLPSQRPRPSHALEGWLNCSVRSLTLQLIFSAAFSLLSFTARIVAVGMILNPIQVVAELVTLYGALTLSWTFYGAGLSLTLVCRLSFLAFIVLNYVGSVRANDPFAWVVIALFLPGTTFMIILFLITLPLLRLLMRPPPPREDAAADAVVVASSVPVSSVPVGVPVQAGVVTGATAV